MIKAADAALDGDAYRKFAFRFRVVIFLLLYLVGFLAPWEGGSRRVHSGTLWLAASTLLARSGWMGLAAATGTVTIFALACLVAGALLRVWGTAYLGSSIMRGSRMQGYQIVAAGPYRYVRNPLYLGSWLLAVGVSILMPLGGGVFFLLATSLFTLLLISGEERFLSAQGGDAYQEYRRRVPRLLPRLAAGGPAPLVRPRWIQAVFAEAYPVAFAICFAIFAWRYNAGILIQCLLICYGGSLVTRAFTRPPNQAVNAATDSTSGNSEGNQNDGKGT